jgi:AraC family transcriptional regulator, transcriptional activator FtrA
MPRCIDLPPILAQNAGMTHQPPLRSVAVLVDDGVAPFEFAIPCEVFGIDRSAQGLPRFEFSVCGRRPGPVRTSLGFELVAPHGLAPLAGADLVVVPALGTDYQPPDDLIAALQAAVRRGARVISMCTGAFILARAGLLEGRRATTHWFHESAFRQSFPQIDLVCDVLYVEDGPILTSAGTAAGIDLCLHVLRQSFGAEAANAVARRMVVPPHRDGGQAQFVETPIRTVEAVTLAPVLDWAQAHLDGELSVGVLSRRAAMSERTFARRFRDETGTTPHHWVLLQRVALAERLLEQGDLGIEQIARSSGFGSATMLRHHFLKVRGTTPTGYRRTFGSRARHNPGLPTGRTA